MLYGRDAERALIGALLDAARASRSGALVLRGEPGAGKTALLEDAREQAADMQVLWARGVESESELPFATLQQLLRPALGGLDGLPAPQAVALRSALGLEEASGKERFLVYSACLTLLSELAEREPVLCVVDDAHWLDAGSSEALQFVARRLDAEGIALLFGAREGEPRGFEAADVPSLALAGLDDAAATALLARGAVEPAPEVRARLLAQTHGNPLALVELPSALSAAQLAGDEPLPAALPMTRQLETVFHERVARLSAETRLLLVVAAADDAEDAGLVGRAAASLGAGADALDAAEQANLVTVEGARLAFRHPLVRSAVYRAATSSARRAAHRALAEALDGEGEEADRRAWHLASSAVEPDEAVVRALEEAAERAAERAGHVTAARTLTRAAELSADPEARARRLVRAASLTSLAGRDADALLLAGQAAPLALGPELRAELAHVRGLAALRQGRPADGIPALVEAGVEIAARDPVTALGLMLSATAAAWQSGERATQLEIARLTARIELPAGEPASTFVADIILGLAAMIRGDTAEGVSLLERAVAWGAITDEPRHVLFASLSAIWLADDEAAGALARRAEQLARRRGEFGTLAEALGGRAAHLVLAQRFQEAAVAAGEAVALARELRADNTLLIPQAVLAIVAAIQGRDEEARAHGEELLALATAKGLPQRAALAVYALAIGDLGHARWTEAIERLDSMEEDGSGANDPVMAALMLPDKIEAAVRAGDTATAQEALAHLEAWARHSGAAAAQPRLESCRALLAEGETATELYEQALHLRLDARPFDLARIRLLYGEHLRRERRRSDARTQLRGALEGFERLGADPWADRARTELRATGETARRRDPSTVDQLTSQELQIARYVAAGHSNKEVAAQLFLSPRTIDAHLRNVFAKLGIKSRTQLAQVSLGGDDGDFTDATGGGRA